MGREDDPGPASANPLHRPPGKSQRGATAPVGLFMSSSLLSSVGEHPFLPSRESTGVGPLPAGGVSSTGCWRSGVVGEPGPELLPCRGPCLPSRSYRPTARGRRTRCPRPGRPVLGNVLGDSASGIGSASGRSRQARWPRRRRRGATGPWRSPFRRT